MNWHAIIAALGSIVVMMVLAFLQNTSFSLSSRSRNTNSTKYHKIAALLSNSVWFITSKYLIVDQHMSWLLFIPYTIATVEGSVMGQRIAIWVENRLGIEVGRK